MPLASVDFISSFFFVLRITFLQLVFDFGSSCTRLLIAEMKLYAGF